jgi:hypothetical protein
MTAVIAEEVEPHPIMKEAVRRSFEYYLDDLELLRLHLEVAALTFSRGNIYPELAELITEDVVIDWPRVPGYYELFPDRGSYDDTEEILDAEVVDEWPTYVDMSQTIPAMKGRCPTCNSPDPMKHPATQFEGEVQICGDPYHDPTAPVVRAVYPLPGQTDENATRQLRYYEGLPK